ncbi:hypothetical protein [Pseudonocardia kunmingensis]|uniref:Serine/threonine protein kinase n=1 Tax=Pseudonocardia kunmingensis TaxID=630975 RepID=A0A543D1E9_9PSEU|nr:hypothetical protein [Pseudonocardia kunmingensis]TQM03173.1 hypothetical protein FB558_7823 [Pseudonocardia kunmingensis]
MTRYAPLLTLGAAAALGGGLLLVNTAATSAGTAPAPVALSAAPAGPDPAPPAAPPAPPAVTDVAYAGRSAGDEVTVAIAVRDGRAVGYVCDGDEVESWLEGTLTGADLRLADAGGTPVVTATATGEAVLGAVTVDGEERPFAAEGVTGPAGLYEGRADVRGVTTRIGWIVDGAGDVTGVASASGVRRPAPALDPADPAATTIDGVPVEVTALDGGDEVIRR